MRVRFAIGLALYAVGAAVTWVAAGADGGTIGAALMIAGGVVLLALVLFSRPDRLRRTFSKANGPMILVMRDGRLTSTAGLA